MYIHIYVYIHIYIYIYIYMCVWGGGGFYFACVTTLVICVRCNVIQTIYTITALGRGPHLIHIVIIMIIIIARPRI